MATINDLSFSSWRNLLGLDPWYDNGGNQAVTGTAGDDQITVNNGNDTVYAGTGHDRIFDKGSGSDAIYGQGGDDAIIAGNGASNYYDGGTGTDAVDFWQLGAGVGVDVNLGLDRADAFNAAGGYVAGFTLKSIENVYGGQGGDTIIGNDVANRIYGNEGNDLLDGGFGNDYLFGGVGNDTAYGGVGNDTLLGGTGADYLAGSVGNDRIEGDFGGDTVLGEAGDDVLIGGWDSDAIYGGAGSDSLFGDVTGVTGLAASLFAGNDYLNGGDGIDYIYGGAGNDTLVGGLGKDSLIGEAGADVFRFASTQDSTIIPGFTQLGLESGYDRIFGFEHGIDRIDVSAIDADTTVAGNQAFTQTFGTTFTDEGQFRVAYDAATSTTSAYFNTDRNFSTAEMVIQLAGNVLVTSSDLYL
ncbi:MAG: calcium-binding protein [Hyphomicrobiaceae bacterium]